MSAYLRAFADSREIPLRTKLITIGVSVLALVAIACSAGESDTAGPGAQDQVSETGDANSENEGDTTIVMEVTGPKTADITYSLGADSSQENGAKLPWKKELTSKESFLLPNIVAQMGPAPARSNARSPLTGSWSRKTPPPASTPS